MALLWMEAGCGVALDAVAFVREEAATSNVLAGMTAVAGVNSMIDVFVDGALARDGYAVMAIVGLFSGQMFNILIGLSINCIITFFVSEYPVIQLYSIQNLIINDKEDWMTIIVIVSVIIILVLQMIIFIMNK